MQKKIAPGSHGGKKWAFWQGHCREIYPFGGKF